jgi:hypothetical protein
MVEQHTASLLVVPYNLSMYLLMLICHIQLKMCIGYTELGNVTGSTARGCLGDTPAAHGEDKKDRSVASVAQKHGTWVEGYSCLRLHSHIKVGYCNQNSRKHCIYVYKLCCHQVIMPKYLTAYFSLQGKIKQMTELHFSHLFLELA